MLSIIIPSYNDKLRLINSLKIIIKYLDLKKFKYELIIVDDGSTDNTIENIPPLIKQKTRILINDKNYGKGASIKKGVLAASGDFIFFSDADLSTPIEEMDNFLTTLNKGYDIAIASRAISGANILIHQSSFREISGKIFNFLVRLLLIPNIYDTQCGFKGFTKEAAKKIFLQQKIQRFGFDVEILYIAQKIGYKIKELPVSWTNAPNSKVNIFTDSLNMLIDLFKIKYLHKNISKKETPRD